MSAIIMDATGLHRTVIRLAHEIGERNDGYHDVVLAGIRRGGEIIAKRIASYLKDSEGLIVPAAGIDIGMTRDALVSAFFVPETLNNELGFSIADKTVVLCDDVLHTGRSAVAGMEALFRLGRPKKIQLLVLVDRGGRELPVRADYAGKNVPTSKAEYIEVCFEELGSCDRFSIIRRDQ